MRTKAGVAGVVIGAMLATGGVAAAINEAVNDDANEGDDGPITGEALDRATEAALTHTGEGTVTDTEVGDEDSYYEVEVTLDDGTQVDVQLDRSFEVVGSERDVEEDED